MRATKQIYIVQRPKQFMKLHRYSLKERIMALDSDQPNKLHKNNKGGSSRDMSYASATPMKGVSNSDTIAFMFPTPLALGVWRSIRLSTVTVAGDSIVPGLDATRATDISEIGAALYLLCSVCTAFHYHTYRSTGKRCGPVVMTAMDTLSRWSTS
jgi:hypothetical protein